MTFSIFLLCKKKVKEKKRNKMKLPNYGPPLPTAPDRYVSMIGLFLEACPGIPACGWLLADTAANEQEAFCWAL